MRCCSPMWRRGRPRPSGPSSRRTRPPITSTSPPSTKRYYPLGALASQVLGFVNT